MVSSRLAHDISPDYYPSDGSDDADTDLQRKKFLFDCLNQATTNINNNNSITHVSQTVCDQSCGKTENITETFTKLQWKEEQLERINNEINKNHLTKEDHNNHINLINNNYLQVCKSEKMGLGRCMGVGGEKGSREWWVLIKKWVTQSQIKDKIIKSNEH